MKRSLPFFLLLSILFVAAPLAAKDSGLPPINTIVVRHFTNADGMTMSPEFFNYFYKYLCEDLVKGKISTQAVIEGTTAPDAVAANSLVLDGKFLSRENAALLKPGKVQMELSLHRLSDHALVKTWNGTGYYSGGQGENGLAIWIAKSVAGLIYDTLKGVDLSSIPPAAPGAATAALDAAPSPGTAPSGPDAVASVQLSSDPTGAEIAIDGNYVGSTPSQVNLKPGAHAIKMTMTGYLPWVRSIETEGGETRNFIADLKKTNP